MLEPFNFFDDVYVFLLRRAVFGGVLRRVALRLMVSNWPPMSLSMLSVTVALDDGLRC